MLWHQNRQENPRSKVVVNALSGLPGRLSRWMGEGEFLSSVQSLYECRAEVNITHAPTWNQLEDHAKGKRRERPQRDGRSQSQMVSHFGSILGCWLDWSTPSIAVIPKVNQTQVR